MHEIENISKNLVINLSLKMKITNLQNEINHLVFLYFTSIGVLQRDCHLETAQEIRLNLQKEIQDCLNRVNNILEDDDTIEYLKDNSEDVLKYSKEYLDEGYDFLDYLLDL